MNEDQRIFGVATDDAIIEMIKRAKRRLLVIAPAFSLAVADALATRFVDLGGLVIRVIVDPDEMVYHLGYGEREALNVLKDALTHNNIDIMEQKGIRIGIVISDDDTMVYAPISKNIEAGSDTVKKPNAIFMSDATTENLVQAAGAEKNIEPTGEHADSSVEIGNEPLNSEKLEAMQEDLERNKPAKFHISRRLQVFRSRVEYVEFKFKNVELGRKQVPLPEDFKIVGNKNIQEQLRSRLRAPMADIGAVEVVIKEGAEPELIDDDWLRNERKRIEDEYTYQINHFGRVIFREDWQAFEKEINQFKKIVEKYHNAVRKKLNLQKDKFIEDFIDGFFPIWQGNPPPYMSKHGRTTDDESLKAELKVRASKIFSKMLNFDPPSVRPPLPKDISPKNVDDPEFLKPLQEIMEQRHVPKHIIDSLFPSIRAAPEQPDDTEG